MKRRCLLDSIIISVVAAGSILALPHSLAAQTSHDALVENARKEGVVVWYTTMDTHGLNLTAKEFMRTHPGIVLQTLRLGSSQLPARVATEQRAGAFNADVISGDQFQLNQLLLSGAIDRYRRPDARAFLPGSIDPEGYWTNLYLDTTVVAWNPERLKEDHLQAPTSFEDLAKPQWKGKLGVDAAAFNWYIGMLQAYKNGAEIVAAIARNDPQKTSGHSQTVVALDSGEFDATPTAYGYMALAKKRLNRNIDYLNPTPQLVSLNPVGLAKNAPHPNAARVLIDWLLSKEGQDFIVHRSGGKASSRTDVANDPAIFNRRRPYVLIRSLNSSDYNSAVRSYRDLMQLP